MNYLKKIINLGVPDKFIQHGSPDQQRKECGIDSKNITKVIVENFKKFNT